MKKGVKRNSKLNKKIKPNKKIKQLGKKVVVHNRNSKPKKLPKKPLKKTKEKSVKKTKKACVRIQKKAKAFPVEMRTCLSKYEEEYMNEKQIEHFRNILLQWKEQLMSDVDRTVHNMQDGSANYPDPIDRAGQEEEFSLELRTRDRDRKLLKKIEEALVRIDEKNYGYCDECGVEIGIKRLEVRPTATLCIECKTISEIREKQIGEIN